MKNAAEEKPKESAERGIPEARRVYGVRVEIFGLAEERPGVAYSLEDLAKVHARDCYSLRAMTKDGAPVFYCPIPKDASRVTVPFGGHMDRKKLQGLEIEENLPGLGHVISLATDSLLKNWEALATIG